MAVVVPDGDCQTANDPRQ